MVDVVAQVEGVQRLFDTFVTAPAGRAAEQVGKQAIGPAAIASAASVGLSWYYFFIRGDRQRGIFVGLWPPTILAFASYFNQKAIIDKLDRSLLGSTGGFESIRRLLD